MDSTDKKTLDKENRKQKILEAALALFHNTHDVKKVSIEAIARKAQVSPTTVYNNFGTRENLVYEVIKVLFRDNIERNRSLIYSNMPFPQKIASVINGKIDLTSRLHSEIIDKMISQDESVAPLFDEIFKTEILPLWGKILDDGKKEGYIDESLESEALIIYLDVLTSGFRVKKEFLAGFNDKIELIKQLTHIMFHGFLKKDIDLFNEGGK
jgi:AcrR family transcriptional regulator